MIKKINSQPGTGMTLDSNSTEYKNRQIKYRFFRILENGFIWFILGWAFSTFSLTYVLTKSFSEIDKLLPDCTIEQPADN